MMKQRSKTSILTAIFILLFIPALVLVITFTANAQSSDDTSQHINLSQTGSADDPKIVIDLDGIIHVLWNDKFNGSTTSRRTEEGWEDPQNENAPFNSFVPELLVDNANGIHAFWFDERNQLFHSRITAENFGFSDSWSRPVELDDFSVNVVVTLDHLGTIHLAYIRTLDTETKPAGVYYTKSANNGATWESPTLLYKSTYFRTLVRDNAHINIATSTQSNAELSSVYVVWDDSALRRIFRIQSTDSGETWESYIEVDGPKNTSGLSAPFNIDVIANENEVLIVWQDGQKGVSCTQLSKFSTDGGQTWSDHQQILKQLTSGGCPVVNRIVGQTASYALLLTQTQDQIFLSAWNGQQWSDPHLESDLGSFIDPYTFAEVFFRCHDIIISNDQLFAVGCDEGAGTDVWFTSLLLGNLDSWFPQPSAWSIPTVLTTSEDEFISPILVSDSRGWVHALWIQSTGIYYSRWEDAQWLQPTQIIKTQGSTSDLLTAAVDADGIIHVLWSSGLAGGLQYSWANTESAATKSEWDDPRTLPEPRGISRSPNIFVDDSNKISVIYTIPINQNRGVYLIESVNRGISWSKSQLIFDATAAGWEKVDNARVSQSDNGRQNVIWTQDSLLVGPIALYFSHRDQGAENWAEAELVVEGNLSWIDIKNTGNKNLHRFWEILDSDRPKLWHEHSTDNGETQESFSSVSRIGAIPGPASSAATHRGQLQLIQVSKLEDTQELTIQNWVWERNQWNSSESILLGPAKSSSIESITSAISNNNQLITLYSSQEKDELTGESLYSLNSAWRLVDEPEGPTTQGEDENVDADETMLLTQTETETVQSDFPTPTTTLQLEVEVTPTLPSANIQPTIAPNQTRTIPSSPIISIVLGTLLASSIVGFVFLGSYFVRRHKK